MNMSFESWRKDAVLFAGTKSTRLSQYGHRTGRDLRVKNLLNMAVCTTGADAKIRLEFLFANEQFILPELTDEKLLAHISSVSDNTLSLSNGSFLCVLKAKSIVPSCPSLPSLFFLDFYRDFLVPSFVSGLKASFVTCEIFTALSLSLSHSSSLPFLLSLFTYPIILHHHTLFLKLPFVYHICKVLRAK